jgi:hypothetical protein
MLLRDKQCKNDMMVIRDGKVVFQKAKILKKIKEQDAFKIL